LGGLEVSAMEVEGNLESGTTERRLELRTDLVKIDHQQSQKDKNKKKIRKSQWDTNGEKRNRKEKR